MQTYIFSKLSNKVLSTSLRMMKPSFSFTSSSDPWKERETTFEKQWFDKEEEKAFRRLLKKIHDQAAVADKHGTHREYSEDLRELQAMLKKFNINAPDAMMADIIEWKYSKV